MFKDKIWITKMHEIKISFFSKSPPLHLFLMGGLGSGFLIV